MSTTTATMTTAITLTIYYCSVSLGTDHGHLLHNIILNKMDRAFIFHHLNRAQLYSNRILNLSKYTQKSDVNTVDDREISFGN